MGDSSVESTNITVAKDAYGVSNKYEWPIFPFIIKRTQTGLYPIHNTSRRGKSRVYSRLQEKTHSLNI